MNFILIQSQLIGSVRHLDLSFSWNSVPYRLVVNENIVESFHNARLVPRNNFFSNFSLDFSLLLHRQILEIVKYSEIVVSVIQTNRYVLAARWYFKVPQSPEICDIVTKSFRGVFDQDKHIRGLEWSEFMVQALILN